MLPQRRLRIWGSGGDGGGSLSNTLVESEEKQLKKRESESGGYCRGDKWASSSFLTSVSALFKQLK